MELYTLAESCVLRLLFSQFFLRVLLVSYISSSRGEMEALVERDSILGHCFPSSGISQLSLFYASSSSFSLLASSPAELAISLKKQAISCFCRSRCSQCPSKSSENSLRKYLIVSSLLSPRQSGSKAKRMLDRLRYSASSNICSSRRPSNSQLTVATHFSSLNGAYSQQRCTSSSPQRLFSRLIRESCLAARRKCTICRIVSRSSGEPKRRVFLTMALVSSCITSPSSPQGYVPSIQTMNSFGIKIYNPHCPLTPRLSPVPAQKHPLTVIPLVQSTFCMIILQ